MAIYPQLEPGQCYHVYNRGNNREQLFLCNHDYAEFLYLMQRYMLPCVDLYAFCLMSNHFHMLFRVISEPEWRARQLLTSDVHPFQQFDPARRLGDCCNAYAKRVNTRIDRIGSLFQKPYRRKCADTQAYLAGAVRYIHRNPERHGFVADFRTWPWSSYHLLVNAQESALRRDQVMQWFGGVDNFLAMHLERSNLSE
jgi:REP element-mobilizing transposase RayT